MKPLFIALEGLDGSGKTTQSFLLKEWMEKNAGPTLLTKEPTNGSVGSLVRSRLKGEWALGMEGLQLLFAADRAHHLEKEVTPALQKNLNVITDRYYYSSIAYGGVEADKGWLTDLNSRFHAPNITLLINVSPKECIRRINASGRGIELFEREALLEKVQKNYLEFAKNTRNFYIVDGERPAEAIARDIQDIVSKHLA